MVEFLSGVDPEAARTAQARYACFDRCAAGAAQRGTAQRSALSRLGPTARGRRHWKAASHLFLTPSPLSRYGADATSYAHAVGVGGAPGCAAEAVSVLRDVARKAAQYRRALAVGSLSLEGTNSGWHWVS